MGLLGSDGQEYRPLAIEALLRVRLEICVLESFVYEAIVPFVQRKGVGWILPLHETLDTVIAGTVFAVAVNFILFGTTKILAVISIYHDFLIGAPLRLIGFAIWPEKKRRRYLLSRSTGLVRPLTTLLRKRRNCHQGHHLHCRWLYLEGCARVTVSWQNS